MKAYGGWLARLTCWLRGGHIWEEEPEYLIGGPGTGFTHARLWYCCCRCGAYHPTSPRDPDWDPALRRST